MNGWLIIFTMMHLPRMRLSYVTTSAPLTIKSFPNSLLSAIIVLWCIFYCSFRVVSILLYKPTISSKMTCLSIIILREKSLIAILLKMWSSVSKSFYVPVNIFVAIMICVSLPTRKISSLWYGFCWHNLNISCQFLLVHRLLYPLLLLSN